MSIKPALTAEQWAEILKIQEGWPVESSYGPMLSDIWDVAGPIGLAALCLKDQPYGFTMERLKTHREVVLWAETFYRNHFPHDESAEAMLAEAKADLVCIAALLPESDQ